ncbi:hypothetical protein ACJMK2_004485 [Sinanodonta woodiana]|uniref:Uncharacterized protein n=1 Tax=Sinanodonta woodiana TaxID=1069815 RepID=A0ABD3Y2L5_SINWO
MMRVLVIIILIGFCLAYSDLPEGDTFTDADVNNPLVQENAHFVLTRSAQEPWRQCNGASLVQVTKASHKGQEKTCTSRVVQRSTDKTIMGVIDLCNCSDK